MGREVMGYRGVNFDVAMGVVSLVAIHMVNNLASHKASPQLFLGNKSMLVCVPANVGKVVVDANANEDIAIRCNAAPAFPEAVFGSRVPPSHSQPIQHQ